MLAVTLRENALTTLDALKTSLGIDPAEEDAQRDATLVQLINAASAWLETQLGRKLGKSTYRQRYCGTGTQQLSLEQYPIVHMCIIVQTYFHIFLNNRELEFNGFEPLSVRLAIFINLNFRDERFHYSTPFHIIHG